MTEFSFKPESFAPIPAGRYRALIESVVHKTSKAGNPMLVAKFVIFASGKRRAINGYYMLAGKKHALRRTEELIKIFHPDNVPAKLNTDNFTNKHCEIDIIYEPKNEGEPPFCKVAAIYPNIEAGSAVAIKGDFVKPIKAEVNKPEFNEFQETKIAPGD